MSGIEREGGGVEGEREGGEECLLETEEEKKKVIAPDSC